jgi:hypothetical protein
MTPVGDDRLRGRWRRHVFAWHQAVDVFCELCGRPLPGRAWVAELDGEHVFCSVDCELLYRARRLAG